MSTKTTEAPSLAIPAEPILMWREQEAIDKYKVFTKDASTRLTNCLAAYRELGLGELTLPELQTLYRGADTVDNFIREKVAGGEPRTIGGLVFSAEKVKEMVEIPDTSDFDSALGHLRQIDKKYNSNYLGDFRLNFAHFEENNGEAVLKEEAMENYFQSRSTYAETEADKEVFLVLSQIAEKQKYLGDKYGFTVTPFQPGAYQPLIYQESGHGIDGVRTTIDVKKIKQKLDQHFGRSRY